MKRAVCPHCAALTIHQHLPVGPLTHLVEEELGPIADRISNGGGHGERDTRTIGLRELLGPSLARRYHFGVRRGCLTPEAADHLAVAFGRHPGELWPVDWFAVDCPQPSVTG